MDNFMAKKQEFKNGEWTDYKGKPAFFKTREGVIAYVRGLNWILKENERFIAVDIAAKQIIDIVEGQL